MARSFPAKYRTTCSECAAEMEPGTKITKRLRGWAHVTCPGPSGEGVTTLGWGTLPEPSAPTQPVLAKSRRCG